MTQGSRRILVALWLLAGCARDNSTSVESGPPLADHLTPAAAQLLDSDGRFRVTDRALQRSRRAPSSQLPVFQP